MINLRKIIISIFGICALTSGAQTLTATYVALADSADNYIKQERWQDAERVIIKALKHEPANKSNYLLWSNLGIVRTNQGNYDGALQAYEIGLTTAPKSTTIITNKARTLLAKGENKEALKSLNQALELDSTLQWPLKMRGLLYNALGDLKKAEQDLNNYEAKYGKDASVIESLGELAAKQGEPVKAIERYKEAYKIEPNRDLADKMLMTAYIYGILYKYEKELSAGLKEYPDDANLYLLRAMLNRSRYQTDAMESDLKTAKKFGIAEDLYNSLTKGEVPQESAK